METRTESCGEYLEMRDGGDRGKERLIMCNLHLSRKLNENLCGHRLSFVNIIIIIIFINCNWVVTRWQWLF